MNERIKKPLKDITYKISGVIPKKKNLWLFGAWEGKNYSDNSKYMFEYVIQHHPEIEAVWMTRNKRLVKTMRENNCRCYCQKSIMGIWLVFRAQVAFVTEGAGDVSSYLNKTAIIQLWHGLGIKAFKWRDDAGNSLFSQKGNKTFQKQYWMTTSELYNKVLYELLEVPYDHMSITGYPRNDAFVSKPHNSCFEKLKKGSAGKKIVAYLPTHRNFGKGIKSENPNSIDGLKELDKVLGQMKFILFYKPHFHEIENLKAVKYQFKNIIIASDECYSDLYSYAHYFDALISDYSTILYEFACTGKPVVLFPYDLDDYKTQDGGLLKYYWDYQVGPMCYSWKETINTIEQLLNNDTWLQKRKEAQKAWHKFNDGNNCKRVFEQVQMILQNSQ